ncbi:hypothetical protein ABGB17_36565 [Sphaerisporangium sp. B11E5]
MVLVSSTQPWVVLGGERARAVSLWGLAWESVGGVGAAGAAAFVVVAVTLVLAVGAAVWPGRVVVGGTLLCGGLGVFVTGWLLAEVGGAYRGSERAGVTVAPEMAFTGVVVLVAGVGMLRLVDAAVYDLDMRTVLTFRRTPVALLGGGPGGVGRRWMHALCWGVAAVTLWDRGTRPWVRLRVRGVHGETAETLSLWEVPGAGLGADVALAGAVTLGLLGGSCLFLLVVGAQPTRRTAPPAVGAAVGAVWASAWLQEVAAGVHDRDAAVHLEVLPGVTGMVAGLTAVAVVLVALVVVTPREREDGGQAG